MANSVVQIDATNASAVKESVRLPGKGDSLDVFLEDFPSVSRAQAIAALDLAHVALVDDAHPA